ncbi:MAG: SRPBCC family protein [Actinobacteria bacterium]|nr:SRPBCC family protein [Actinomycetota bacterium]
MAGKIEQSIEVEVPVRTAYNQWTQFEEFPQFMEGVESVKQLDDTHVHWVAEIAGKRHEWDAEITEQNPDERVAWKATDGKMNAGVVTFHRLGESKTKLMVQMDYEPEGIVERVGHLIDADERRVKGDLERFKELVESRGTETGAWRGEVEQDATS